MFQEINSKIILKIAMLITLEIALIVGSFGVISFYQSQQSSLANTINIAGKNRFLTSNLLLQTESYMDGSATVSDVKNAANSLQYNLLSLKHGGVISGVNVEPLPSAFSGMWNSVRTKWNSFNASIFSNLITPSENGKLKPGVQTSLKHQLELLASSLITSSNSLVNQLAQQADKNFRDPILFQFIFVILNIGILVLILFIIARMLKPIFVLTDAMSRVKKGDLQISINEKGNDELSILTRSFNLMLETIRNYVKKQEQLTGELAKANEELKQSNQLKDDFINVAAHELRTPIQPILGLAQILRTKIRRGDEFDENFDKEEQSKVLDIIIKNAKKLLLLEDNILDIARIESKSLKLSIEEVDLDDVISNVVHETRDFIDGNKVSLYYNKEGSASIIVNADKARISQVLSNLLCNSIKFTEMGSILISLEGKDNSAVVTIKDTGQGIDPEILPKLFTKFATKSKRGVGLGLYICKTIVDAHGGKISAENNKDGKGASFSFTLPAQVSRIENNSDSNE